MTLVSPSPDPTSTVVQACRDVIGAAGQVTATIMSAGADPRSALEAVKRVNPALAGPLAVLMDSVATLDHRTGFLDETYPNGQPLV